MNESEFDEKYKEYLKIKTKVDKLNNKLSSLFDYIKENCEHKNIYIKKKYYEGNYLDKSEDHIYEVCNYCGKVLKAEVKYGFYG